MKTLSDKELYAVQGGEGSDPMGAIAYTNAQPYAPRSDDKTISHENWHVVQQTTRYY